MRWLETLLLFTLNIVILQSFVRGRCSLLFALISSCSPLRITLLVPLSVLSPSLFFKSTDNHFLLHVSLLFLCIVLAVRVACSRTSHCCPPLFLSLKPDYVYSSYPPTLHPRLSSSIARHQYANFRTKSL